MDAPGVERGAIQRIVDRFVPDIDTVAAAIAAEYATRLEGYARLGPAAHEQIIASAKANLLALTDEITSPSDLSNDGHAQEFLGAERMRMGISVDALMQSFTVWGQHAWTAIRAHADPQDPSEVAALLTISEHILRHIEHGTARAAQGYLREAAASWTDRELTRFAVLEALVTDRYDGDELRGVATDGGIATAYRAIVTEPRNHAVSDRRDAHLIVRTVARVVERSERSRRGMVGIHQGVVFALWPGDASEADLSTALEGLADELPGFSIGVGAPSTGLSNISRSFVDAREAARIGVAVGLPSPVRHEDVRLERAILGCPALCELGRDVLAPIAAYDLRRRSDLIRSLASYVDTGGDIAQSALRMHIHPNTMLYRLRRVAEISGHDPRDGRGLVVLSLAILADRMDSSGTSRSL